MQDCEAEIIVDLDAFIVYVVVTFIVIIEWFVSVQNPTKTKRQPFWMKRAVVYGLIIL